METNAGGPYVCGPFDVRIDYERSPQEMLEAALAAISQTRESVFNSQRKADPVREWLKLLDKRCSERSGTEEREVTVTFPVHRVVHGMWKPVETSELFAARNERGFEGVYPEHLLALIEQHSDLWPIFKIHPSQTKFWGDFDNPSGGFFEGKGCSFLWATEAGDYWDRS